MFMTRHAQEIGKKAEMRVYELALKLGSARLADPDEDHGEKTDVIFEGRRIQVSCSQKSNRQRRLLEKRGITNIPAGDSISDEQIIVILLQLLHS